MISEENKNFLSCKNQYTLYFQHDNSFLDKIKNSPCSYSAKIYNLPNDHNFNSLCKFFNLTNEVYFSKKNIKLQDVLPVNSKSKENSRYNKNNNLENLFLIHAKNITDYNKFIYDENFNKITFHEKNLFDCSLFNHFYFVEQRGYSQPDIDGFEHNLTKYLNHLKTKKDYRKKTVLFLFIENKKYIENYKIFIRQFLTEEKWKFLRMKISKVVILSPLWFKNELKTISKELQFDDAIYQVDINSSLVNFNQHNEKIFIFNQSNKDIITAFKLLNKIYKSIKKSNENYTLFHFYKSIRQEIVLNDFGLRKNFSLIKERLSLLLSKWENEDNIENIKNIDKEINNLFLTNIEQEDLEGPKEECLSWILEQIHLYKYENIYINYSKHYVTKNFSENFLKNLEEEIKTNSDLNINIKILDKNYPVLTKNDKKTLIINLGQDLETNYFIGKLDCLFIVDISGYQKITNIKKKKYPSFQIIQNKQVDDVLDEIEDINEKISEVFSKKSYNQENNNFILINNTTKKHINFPKDKKIFYCIENEGSFAENTIEEIYNLGFEDFYTFCLEDNMDKVKEIWDKLLQQVAEKNQAIRNKIKNTIQKEIKHYKKYGTKLEFYQKQRENLLQIYDEIINHKNLSINIKSIEKERATIQNLHIWVEKETLPQKRNVFEALMKYIKYSEDFNEAWKALKKEVTSNQQEGRNKNQELNDFFKNGFVSEDFRSDSDFDHDTFNDLLKEIKKENLNKKYDLKLDINTNLNREDADE